MRFYLTFLILITTPASFAQVKGSIVDSATPSTNPLDPNGDGFVTSTGVAFTGPSDETQFEIPYLPIQQYQPETDNDNQVTSGVCEAFELVSDPVNNAEASYYYYQDPDGIPGNGDDRIFFRFRTASVSNSSTAFSILMDVDYKFGFSGPEMDPNAVVGNPGFELEIIAKNVTGPNGGLRVYNVDGTANPTVVNHFYPITSNFQVSHALNQYGSCASPAFVDIFIPFSALGITTSTQIRMVAAVNDEIASSLGGGASDIGGVDGDIIPDDDDQFVAAILNYSPVALANSSNKAPAAIDAAVSVSENKPIGTAVHLVSATDPNGDVLSFSITGGNTGSAFAINSSTGQITVNNSSALNIEATPVFTLTVRVSDGALYDNAIITINLNDLNEQPPAGQDAFISLDENTANAVEVHTVSASDPDANAVLSFSIIAGNTTSAFSINSASGAIIVNNSAALDFETTPSFTLTVRVSDGTLSDDVEITVNLNDVNEMPTASADATISLIENAPNGTPVHTVTATDPDAGTVFTYSITGGNTGNAFAVSAAGAITVSNSAALDFETMPSLTLTVSISDGTLFDDVLVTINLNDVNEMPSAGVDVTTSLIENAPNSTGVHIVTATDPDAGASLTYSIIAGSTANAFAINSASGSIIVNNSAALDFETTPSFTLTVRVSDGTLSDDVEITVNLNDVNEMPTASADATISLIENAPNGTPVHTVTATDPDAGTVFTYSITGGNTGNAFAVSAAGAITVSNSAALDFETMPSLTLTVSISDGTLFDDVLVTVNLNDVNEMPSAGVDVTTSLIENAANGTAVHSVTATDPDAGASLTYSIIAGNTASAYAINSASGAIIVSNSAALDFETTPSFTLTVRVSDGTLFDDVQITVNLNNVNEMPSAGSDATISSSENAANGTIVHSLTATDPDAATILTYSITDGNTGNAFEVSGAGAIIVNNSSALDFETTPSFTLTVRVSDGSLFDDVIVVINLDDVNEPPSGIDTSVILPENSANDTPVHFVAATDPDLPSTQLIYSIIGGNTAAAFSIDSDGQISVSDITKLDFETSPVFSLVVQVSDGILSSQSIVTVYLADVNETPAAEDASIRIDEGLPMGIIVHRVQAADPDSNDRLYFSLEDGNTGSSFSIDPDKGDILINDSQQMRFDSNPVFELTARVRDRGGLFADSRIRIELNSVPESTEINPLKGFSPNGDGINDFWMIGGIEAFPENEVNVFNRWGVRVFQSKHYDNDKIVWRGETMGNPSSGNRHESDTTYFFIINIEGLQPITGYLIVKG